MWTSAHRATTRRAAYGAWIAVCVLWGTTYLAIRIALETLPPLLMAGSRYIVAGTILMALLKVRGEQLAPRDSWPRLALLGLLLLGFGNGGIVWAEQTVPSGLAALLAAMTPFWMVGIDAAMPEGQRLTPLRIAGLIVGFVGIVLLVSPELDVRSGRRFPGGVIAVILGTLVLGEPFSPRPRLSSSSESRWCGGDGWRGSPVLARSACRRCFGQTTRRPLISRTRKSTMAMTSST